MKVLKQSHKVLGDIGPHLLWPIEKAGRVCYKSHDENNFQITEKFVRSLITRGHHSVLEHVNISVHFITDRGVTHELVRHRLAAYSQESTRYCNYADDKFGNDCTFIVPVEFEADYTSVPQSYCRKTTPSTTTPTNPLLAQWRGSMYAASQSYLNMIEQGAKPQLARSVLPNSLKTEITMTCNAREWRHVLGLRTGKAAHPQMQALMKPLLAEFQSKIPVLFDDIGET